MEERLFSDIQLYKSFIRQNQDGRRPSNSDLLLRTIQRKDAHRLLLLLQINCDIESILYKDVFKDAAFVVTVADGLLASGFSQARMKRLADSLNDTSNADLAALKESLLQPLALKEQCRVYLKRYFSCRGRLCAEATKMQRGYSRKWRVDFIEAVDKMPIASSLQKFLLLEDVIDAL
jgi:hypothetical protein